MRHSCISFILVICVLIQTVALLLHHHHENIPCFKEDITLQCCSGHEDNSCNKNHGQHENEGGHCVLEQLILANDQNSNNTQNAFRCNICMHDHNNQMIQAILLAFRYDFFIPLNKEKGQEPPYLITYHSEYINRIPGLRAPPVA